MEMTTNRELGLPAKQSVVESNYRNRNPVSPPLTNYKSAMRKRYNETICYNYYCMYFAFNYVFCFSCYRRYNFSYECFSNRCWLFFYLYSHYNLG